MQSNGVRRRKVVRYESVSKTANAYLRSDHLSLGGGSAESANAASEDSGAAYRYEYEYERSSVEFFAPASSSPLGNGTDILTQAVGDYIARQFAWVAETDTIRTYENRLTRRYVHIDRLTGQFCNQQRGAISAQAALSYAMPASEVLPSRLLFPALPGDLQIGGFVRQPSSIQSSVEPELSQPEATQPTGVFSQIRRVLVMKLRPNHPPTDTLERSSGQRAAVSLHEDHRGSRPSRDDFNLAAFTRRSA